MEANNKKENLDTCVNVSLVDQTSNTINALMHANRTAHINVCPTLELKNVATRRLNELREEKRIQRLLLHMLQDTAVNTNLMQSDKGIRINTGIRIDADINSLSFNEHVSEIISLQDTILLDYVRVCNIRLRSQQLDLVACRFICSRGCCALLVT